MSFTSDELNYLIYRYMKEAGFEHSAFTFAAESRVIHFDGNPSEVLPGTLVYIVQKGLQFMEVEATIQEDGTEIELGEPLTLLTPYNATKKRKRAHPSTPNSTGSPMTTSMVVVPPPTSSSAAPAGATNNINNSSSISSSSNSNNSISQQTFSVNVSGADIGVSADPNLISSLSSHNKMMGISNTIDTTNPHMNNLNMNNIVISVPVNNLQQPIQHIPTQTTTSTTSSSSSSSSSSTSTPTTQPSVTVTMSPSQNGPSDTERDRKRKKKESNRKLDLMAVEEDLSTSIPNTNNFIFNNMNGNPTPAMNTPPPTNIYPQQQQQHLPNQTNTPYTNMVNPNLMGILSNNSNNATNNGNRFSLPTMINNNNSNDHTDKPNFSKLDGFDHINNNNNTNNYNNKPNIAMPKEQLEMAPNMDHKPLLFNAPGVSGSGGGGGSTPVRTTSPINHTLPPTTLPQISNIISPLSSSHSPSSSPSRSTTGISNSDPSAVHFSSVAILEGHTGQVRGCIWNPKQNILASGSLDGTARLWKLPPVFNVNDIVSMKKMVEEVNKSHIILKATHGSGAAHMNEKLKEVYSLDWNQEGTLLATGYNDGSVRVWDCKGKRRLTLDKHSGIVYAVKWGPETTLLSASGDKSVIAWDTNTGLQKQKFEFYKGPVVSADWLNKSIFASACKDHNVYIGEIGRQEPLRILKKHTGEVNAVRWSPLIVSSNPRILVSCSDDRTCILWRFDESNPNNVYEPSFLSGHSSRVYSVEWSPVGVGSYTNGSGPLVSSASDDCTVKIWDVETEKCLNTLIKNKERVCAMTYSPNGAYLATGYLDSNILIWSVKDGKPIKSYKAPNAIEGISWSSTDRISAAHSNSLSVFDFKL
eukprot:TRINITY_DN1908_c0_g1_i2.p1 TRINITY_DN1908_c0_g1~~TRINITY_DN1908_c0_g1_i2.p1  ORF type:complete len:867 (+),score=216.17 TRINITY_DN1908_c0_g1_i2:52-2652(+)